KFNLEIGGRLPLAKHFENSGLSIFVLRGRALRAFVPADHIFHLVVSLDLICGVGWEAARVYYRPGVFGVKSAGGGGRTALWRFVSGPEIDGSRGRSRF